MSKSYRPSDRLTKSQRFEQQQLSLPFSTVKSDVDAIYDRLQQLSPAERRALVLAAPAFVAGEGRPIGNRRSSDVRRGACK